MTIACARLGRYCSCSGASLVQRSIVFTERSVSRARSLRLMRFSAKSARTLAARTRFGSCTSSRLICATGAAVKSDCVSLELEPLAVLRVFAVEAADPVEHLGAHVRDDEPLRAELRRVAHQRPVVEVVRNRL